MKGRLGQSQVAHYKLDRLGVQHALHLPSMESTPGSSGNINRFQTLQDSMPDMPDDVKQRLTSLLAAEFSKKVHCCWRLPVFFASCRLVPASLSRTYSIDVVALNNSSKSIALWQQQTHQAIAVLCLLLAYACAHHLAFSEWVVKALFRPVPVFDKM